MCSRIFITPGNALKLLLAQFGLEGAELPELNNVAPTEAVPVIYREGDHLNVSPMRWWLHPSWSPEPPNQHFAMFNARIETVLTSRAFRGPIRQRRGIMPISGFIEFQTVEKQKKPFFVQAASEDSMAAAAIWECWHNQVWSVAMITQASDPLFSEVHDRMPLTLTPDQAQRWINPSEDAATLLQDLKGQSVELVWRPVDSRLNSARNKLPPLFV